MSARKRADKTAGPARRLLKIGETRTRVTKLTSTASEEASEAPLYERDDWMLFRSLETLGQKAGVPRDLIARLVAKELVDNALDVAGTCRFGLLGDDGFFVEDDGAGFASPELLARLFSVGRPLTGSKFVRLPTRGALGNGLRVVAGAVLASGGTLTVATRGKKYSVVPNDDGTAEVSAMGRGPTRGTRIEVTLGAGLIEGDVLAWARRAQVLAQAGSTYRGGTSAHWYTEEAFFELCQAAGQQTVRALVARFDGFAEPKAGKATADFHGRPAAELSRTETARLLAALRARARPVRPPRLGFLGKRVDGLPHAYARTVVEVEFPSASGVSLAIIPVVVEAWAELANKPEVLLHVNRTAVTADVRAYHEKTEMSVFGCNLSFAVPKVGRAPARMWLNIQSPYVPITTDGKDPDLSEIDDDIGHVIAKAIRSARRTQRGSYSYGRQSQKAGILDVLDAAIDKASDGGRHRFDQRQLFYVVRDLVSHGGQAEPSYTYFTHLLTNFEGERGDIPGMYRDARGTLYHPHTGDEIPLGTLHIEQYKHPAWTFNKVLYCEKEGLLEVLKHERWPERHDCALLSSKGFANRAARDVIDLLGKSQEELTFYCVHDADGHGTKIYEALQEATAARPARKVRIENLGLEPWEAVEMGLLAETVQRSKKSTDEDRRIRVASYVLERVDGDTWVEWLQGHRIELNTMRTPEFVAWLDRKMKPFDKGKVVPPPAVLAGQLDTDLESRIRSQITARILVEQKFDEQVANTYKLARPSTATLKELPKKVKRALTEEPEETWKQPVERIAHELADMALHAELDKGKQQ